MLNIITPSTEESALASPRRLAEAVRAACVRAALAGYEDASLSGLCQEGALERAIDAMLELKLDEIIQAANYAHLPQASEPVGGTTCQTE